MDIRIQIRQTALVIPAHGILKRGIALGIRRIPAPPIVSIAGWLVLIAVAVNIHVGKLAIRALDVEDAVVGEVVLAVGKTWEEEGVLVDRRGSWGFLR